MEAGVVFGFDDGDGKFIVKEGSNFKQVRKKTMVRSFDYCKQLTQGKE